MDSQDFGMVIETTYNDVTCLYNNELVKLTLDKVIKGPVNKVLFTGDRVVIKDKKVIGILRRMNILSRDKYDYTKLNSMCISKVIAVNIDIGVIVVSSGMPPLHPKLIDRYVILLENAKIPYILVLNKCDLLSSKDRKILDIYKEIGMKVILTSTITSEGIDEVKKELSGKQAILLGHSGVGKSSIIKRILGNDDVRTGGLNKKTMKGRHTTTTSTCYEWEDNSRIIDTPGIRSLDISSFPKEEIQNYFKEFIPFRDKCKYNNCLHYKEDSNDCEIKRQVSKGVINKDRYESYYKILDGLK